jgi:catechol 2,3-dioxygenase-like lactoylglutathione lyase family enzyme
MRKSLAFYRDVLGFEVVADSGNGDHSSWVWVRNGDLHLMLNDQYEPGQEPAEAPAERQKWHHDTCLYFSADPDAVYEYLRTKNIDLKPPDDAPYGMRQLYLNDPDGYNLCFQQPVK